MKAAMRRTSPVAEGTSPLQHRCSVRIGSRCMRKCSALGAALIGVFAAILPANGEDAGIYAFIHSEARGRSYTPPLRVAPQIATRTLDFSPRRRSTRPAIARVPAVARVRVSKTVVDEPSPKITRDPKTIGEISNPLLALLADENSQARRYGGVPGWCTGVQRQAR